MTQFGNVNFEEILSNEQAEVEVNVTGDAGKTPEQSVQDVPKEDVKQTNPGTENQEGLIEIEEPVNPVDKDAPVNTGTPTGKPADNSSPSPYKLFSKKLYEDGVLTVYDEEQFDKAEDPEDAMVEMVRQTILSEIDNYKNSLPEKARRIIEHAERTGELDLDKVVNLQREMLALERISESSLRDNEAEQERLLVEDLKQKGYTDTRIKRYVDNVKATESLFEESLDALESLKQRKQEEDARLAKEAELRVKLEEKERAETLKAIQKNVYDTSELIPGVKLTEKEHKELYTSMTTAVTEDQQGNPINAVGKTRMENPLAFDMMVHFLHSKGVFNLDPKTKQPKPDWSYVTKGLKTEVAKNAEKATQSQFSAGNPGNVKQGSDLLSALKSTFGGA